MKAIGFIDYYISEWHANNYPAWIKEASARLGLDYEVKYAYALRDVSPLDEITTDEWCKNFGVERCASIAEIAQKADFLVILAPSDPEEHLALAREALAGGKRTYIDKTFAPNLDEAKEIFALSEKFGAPIFSTSALRYASELSAIGSAKTVNVTGGGSNLPEYIIHQIEIAVVLLGRGASALKVEKVGDEYVTSVSYSDGRAATLSYCPTNSFSVSADGGEKVAFESDFFAALMEKILCFFETEEIPVSKEDTLEVMAIRTALIKAYENLGATVEI
ncbi:MAG: hypothetical protein J6Q68_01215 [Clostridia bacterium]|nr:hypothetical protein [Clostridia bacterium]